MLSYFPVTGRWIFLNLGISILKLGIVCRLLLKHRVDSLTFFTSSLLFRIDVRWVGTWKCTVRIFYSKIFKLTGFFASPNKSSQAGFIVFQQSFTAMLLVIVTMDRLWEQICFKKLFHMFKLWSRKKQSCHYRHRLIISDLEFSITSRDALF